MTGNPKAACQVFKKQRPLQKDQNDKEHTQTTVLLWSCMELRKQKRYSVNLLRTKHVNTIKSTNFETSKCS